MIPPAIAFHDPNNDGDTDGDGFLDKDDPCPHNFDEGSGCPGGSTTDTDNDGIPDSSDDCPEGGATGTEDFVSSDPASWDGCPEPIEPVDFDGDGHDSEETGGDDCDDFNEFVNPSVDEVPDNGIDDNCNGEIDETVPVDTDKDSIPDVDDNCPTTPNTDQANFDGDEFGDVCDDDIDGDSVPNDIDNCDNTPTGTEVDEFGCPLDTGDEKKNCAKLRENAEKEKGNHKGITKNALENNGCN